MILWSTKYNTKLIFFVLFYFFISVSYSRKKWFFEKKKPYRFSFLDCQINFFPGDTFEISFMQFKVFMWLSEQLAKNSFYRRQEIVWRKFWRYNITALLQIWARKMIFWLDMNQTLFFEFLQYFHHSCLLLQCPYIYNWLHHDYFDY